MFFEGVEKLFQLPSYSAPHTFGQKNGRFFSVKIFIIILDVCDIFQAFLYYEEEKSLQKLIFLTYPYKYLVFETNPDKS